ncbi:MAG: XTP/dITP diphosphatase [Desulfurococcaceae archaeon]
MTEICIVTSNEHKFKEISKVAEEYNVKVHMCPGLKLEIQSLNLEEIVVKSAMLAYIYLNKPLLVEDAGLFIDALNGFPGPFSSYVYNTIGIQGILKLMKGVSNRKACFRSVVALIVNNNIFKTSGEICGEIVSEPRGSFGFGFDPIFKPCGVDKTFAEMEIDEKNKYSHRAKSVRRALEMLLGNQRNMLINQK